MRKKDASDFTEPMGLVSLADQLAGEIPKCPGF